MQEQSIEFERVEVAVARVVVVGTRLTFLTESRGDAGGELLDQVSDLLVGAGPLGGNRGFHRVALDSRDEANNLPKPLDAAADRRRTRAGLA